MLASCGAAPSRTGVFVVTPVLGVGSDYCILNFSPTRATISDFYPSRSVSFHLVFLAVTIIFNQPLGRRPVVRLLRERHRGTNPWKSRGRGGAETTRPSRRNFDLATSFLCGFPMLHGIMPP